MNTQHRTALSRRDLLKAGGAGLLAIQIAPSGLLTGKAWAAMPRATQPETFATLVQMSRDTYPHDSLEDKFYAAAVETLDEAARAAPEALKLLEDGVRDLNDAAREAHGSDYTGVADEAKRVALLKDRADSPFFQKVRSNLVTGLYNNKELWPVFGYEGESASKGGYLYRGFDDIDWL